jgi:biotin carboxyl carrier protein
MSADTVTVNGETFTVFLKRRMGSSLTFLIDEREYTVPVDSTARMPSKEITVEYLPKQRAGAASSSSKTALPPEIRAPLPGIISDIKVNEGDTVSAGGTLVVIEAMKMENPIKAATDLRVTKVHVKKGQEITHGTPLVSVEPA